MARDLEFQNDEADGAMEFNGGDTQHIAYDESVIDKILVGKSGGWKKFKNFFKKIFKGAAKSEMAKDALNAYSPGAGDAMQSGIQLIESASSGNKDALNQVAAIAKVAKDNPNAQPAHELLMTLNEARKEAKAEAVAVGHGWGGWGGRPMDPRDMYLGPRIDVDDDGQPILVGHHHGGHGGGFRGWGGGYGLWQYPMFEEVIILEDDDGEPEVKRVKK